MRIYIAGPMRGLKDWNFSAFDEAEKKWRAKGHVVFSPAQIDRALGYGPAFGADTRSLYHVMLSDIACLYHTDAIGLLPGWENSSGTTVELALAQFLGLQIYDALTMEPIQPSCKPWNKIREINWPEKLDRSYD